MTDRKEMVKAFLLKRLNSVYCDTCAGDMDDNCDECHRKNMMWELSDSAAESMANEIVNYIG